MSDPTQSSIKNLVSQSARALRNHDYQQAIELADEILAQDSDHAGALAVRFSSLFKSEQFERARRMGGEAAVANPRSVFILNNQACLQLEAKQPAAAAGLLKSLIDEFGEQPQWLYNLALAQRMVGNYDRATTLFKRTLDYQVDHDKAAYQLADCLKAVGNLDQAVSAMDYVRLLRSKHAPSHSDYIGAAVHSNTISPACLEQEMDLWGARFIPPENRYSVEAIKDPSAIRIGFVLAQFSEFWFNSSIEPIINALANGTDKVFLYYHDRTNSLDELSDHIEQRDCHDLTDAEFARSVRRDRIEVLVDLCGMTPNNRQRALGLQLAGRQFSWLGHDGYFPSNLIKSLDQELGLERYAFEQQSVNSHAFSNYSSLERSATSSSSTLPAKSFLGIAIEHGLSDVVIKTWAQILKQSRGWTLSLPVSADHVKKSHIERFKILDIDASRLNFDSSCRLADDTIVLDNFVCNNPAESFASIQNGNPLVTLKGPLFPAQHSALLLEQLGKKGEICSSTYEYQEYAITLAAGKISSVAMSTAELEKSDCYDIDSLTSRIREVFVAAQNFDD